MSEYPWNCVRKLSLNFRIRSWLQITGDVQIAPHMGRLYIGREVHRGHLDSQGASEGKVKASPSCHLLSHDPRHASTPPFYPPSCTFLLFFFDLDPVSLEVEYQFITHTNIRERKFQGYGRKYRLPSVAVDDESGSTKLQRLRMLIR